MILAESMRFIISDPDVPHGNRFDVRTEQLDEKRLTDVRIHVLIEIPLCIDQSHPVQLAEVGASVLSLYGVMTQLHEQIHREYTVVGSHELVQLIF